MQTGERNLYACGIHYTQRLEQTVSQSGGQQSNTGGCCLVDKESKAEGGLLHARVSRARRLGRRFSHSVSGVSVLVRVVAHAVRV